MLVLPVCVALGMCTAVLVFCKESFVRLYDICFISTSRQLAAEEYPALRPHWGGGGGDAGGGGGI